MPSVDQLNVDQLALGLAGGSLALAVASRPTARRTFPLLASLAIILLSPPFELTLAVGAAALVGVVPAGWGTRQMARSARARVLAGYGLVTLAGMWAALPDTEGVLVALGVVVPAAAVAVIRQPVTVDLVGWPLLAATIAIAAASSSADQLGVTVSALGCFGLLVVAPLVGLVDERAIVILDPTAGLVRAGCAAIVGLAVVTVCARVASAESSAGRALVIVAACWSVAAAILVVLALSFSRSAQRS